MGLRRGLLQGLKTTVITLGRRAPFVIDGARWLHRTTRRIRFDLFRRAVPIDRRVVVFDCFVGRAYTCSPRALYRAMLADPRFAEYEFIWSFREPLAAALAGRGLSVTGVSAGTEALPEPSSLEQVFGEEALAELGRASIVAYGSDAYHRAYARAGTWVVNSVAPTYLTPVAGQVYLQTWHGTPFKRLGCDIPRGARNAMFSVAGIHRWYRAEGRRMTHLVSPSPFTTEKLSTAFAITRERRDEVVIEEGYPRNDVLAAHTDDQAAAIRGRLRIPADKRVILYAPTWRDDSHDAKSGYTFDVAADFERLRADLGDDHVILFRAHYLVANAFDFSRFEGFVYDVSAVNDINDLYLVSDLLVTDYSSVFFDYAILDRPIVFYLYDLESYADELRGFYLELDELPGPVVRTEAGLVAAIKDSSEEPASEAERRRVFRDRFSPLDDGHAAERVLSRIMPSSAPVQRP